MVMSEVRCSGEEKTLKSRKEVATATMKDVAQKAQVSTATVSRALMNPDKVSQATRNRVSRRRWKWVLQAMGRNVKRNESRTILVIVPDICDPFFSEIIRGIEVTAAEQGYLVLIGDCAHQNQQEKPLSTSLSPSRSTACCCLALACRLMPALKSSVIYRRW
jgi:LacI family repressor for deo operon, udp, cdd, tsx, nupC, and nupG